MLINCQPLSVADDQPASTGCHSWETIYLFTTRLEVLSLQASTKNRCHGSFNLIGIAMEVAIFADLPDNESALFRITRSRREDNLILRAASADRGPLVMCTRGAIRCAHSHRGVIIEPPDGFTQPPLPTTLHSHCQHNLI